MLRASIAAGAFVASLAAPRPSLAADPPPGPKAAASTKVAVPSAPAEPDFRPNPRAAVAVGMLTMLVSGAIGGTRAALGNTDGDKTAGLLVACGGFSLAPIFSHMVTHEWERAAQFGTLPVLTTVAGTAYISHEPHAVFHGDMGTRTAFGIIIGLGLIGAVVGVWDAALADERVRDRAKASHAQLFVGPSVGPEGAALTIGGAL